MEAREFGGGLFGIEVQGHAGHGRAVHFQKPVVIQALQNLGARAADEFLVLHGLPDERDHRADILFEDAPDLLILVRVNHGPDALVAEDLAEQALVHAAVQQVCAGNALTAGLGPVLELREKSGREVGLAFFDEIFRLGNRKLARQRC